MQIDTAEVHTAIDTRGDWTEADNPVRPNTGKANTSRRVEEMKYRHLQVTKYTRYTSATRRQGDKRMGKTRNM